MMFSMYWYGGERRGEEGVGPGVTRLAVEQLINVLNISIPFHHVLRSLNTPPSCSITLSSSFPPLALPHLPLSGRGCNPYCSSSSSSTHCKVNLKVCKVALLCVLTSCGQSCSSLREEVGGRNESKMVSGLNRIRASSLWKSMVLLLENCTLSNTRCFEKRQTPLKPPWLKHTYVLSVQVNDVKWLQGISGLRVQNL